MKRWLIPVTIVALMIAGATAGAFASGEKDRGPADENLPPVSSDDASTQPGCELGASECDDTPDTCEQLALRSDCGIDPYICNQFHNIDACDGPVLEPPDDPAVQDVSDLTTHDLGDSTDSACDPVPLRSDCGIDPDECNLVHNIDACDSGTFEVTVQFNESVTQDNIDEVGALLGEYDSGVTFVVMEIFPPIGRAELTLETLDECSTIEAQLEAESFVTSVTCGPAPEDGAQQDEPDTPVVQPAQ